MAKKQPARFTDTIETLKPYLDRALTDPEFRDDLKDALEAARELYGPLTKGNGNVSVAAKRLATDKKAQKQVKRAVEDLQRATATLQKGKKKQEAGPQDGAPRRDHRRCALQPVDGAADAGLVARPDRRERRPEPLADFGEEAAPPSRPRPPSTVAETATRTTAGKAASARPRPQRTRRTDAAKAYSPGSAGADARCRGCSVGPAQQCLDVDALDGHGALERPGYQPARAGDVVDLEQHGAGRGREAPAAAGAADDSADPSANETSSARRQATRNGYGATTPS